jgi:hypothetical protein
MEVEPPSRSPAARGPWLPLTAGRVAAFASAGTPRLLLVATLAALLVGAVSARFLAVSWWPVLDRAISQLPVAGSIRAGRLVWPANSVETLADNGLLAVVVNPTGQPRSGPGADVQIEFAADALNVASLLGYVAVPYPAGLNLPLNRTELEPRWGAWQPHLLVATGALIALGLLACWCLLAVPLAVIIAPYARLLGRPTAWAGCWRLGVAAFVPGALVLAAAVALYTSRQIGLPEVLLAVGVQVFLSLLLLLFAPFWLPAREPASPFRPVETPPSASPTRADTAGTDANPFAPPPEPRATPAPPPAKPISPPLALAPAPAPASNPAPPPEEPPDDMPLNPS